MNVLIFRVGALFACVALLAGCIFSSAMEAPLIGKKLEAVPGKVFVLSYRNPELTRDFQDSYMATIAAEFSRLGSVVDSAKVTGLELVKDGHIKQIQDFKPDVVMVVHFDLSNIYNGFYHGKIFLNLVAYQDDTQVWRSAQTFKSKTFGYGPASAEGQRFAKQALLQLQQNNVLPGVAEAGKK